MEVRRLSILPAASLDALAAEIERMYVRPTARWLGIGRAPSTAAG